MVRAASNADLGQTMFVWTRKDGSNLTVRARLGDAE